jgi:CRP/FNR family cyclic AMP-dependent transcriptional regulator
MLLQQLMDKNEDLKKLLSGMPQDIRGRCSLKLYKSDNYIIKKGDEIKYVGILCKGELNVLNEFANGSIYLFHVNEAIDFIGEMEILANQPLAVVTNQAKSDCMVLKILKSDFLKWIEQDNYITSIVAKRLAIRLCHESPLQGYSHYYPAAHMIKRFIVEYVMNGFDNAKEVLINKKRQEIANMLGISIKTVDRNIKKLKEQDLVTIKKGKIYVNEEQYLKLVDMIEVW